MYSILRTWGMCIAVPVGGTIVLTQMAQGIDGGSGESSRLSSWQDGVILSQENREHMGGLFLGGFQVLWRFLMGVSVLGGLSSLLIR
jgi:hypothetical protein